MSKARKAASPREETDEKRGILPVPAPVLRHHAAILLGPMREWATRKHLPPVLLLTGTAGTGKRHVAYWLAQWILCERSGFTKPQDPEGSPELDMFSGSLFGESSEAEPSGDSPSSAPSAAADPAAEPAPCGECASCQRAIKGNWVDFTEVLPEDGDPETGPGGSLKPSGTLKVDQFRKIKSSLGFGAHEGAYRIVLIPNADRMTVQAANSVLKLLEEPPPGWLFFLTASDPTLVLPTILSRCQTLRLRPFAPETVQDLLAGEGVSPERAVICANLSQGSWTKALALATDEAWSHRDALFDFLKDPAANLTALVDWASASPAQFDLLVDQLEQIVSDLVRWSVSPASSHPERHVWINADGRTALIAHSQAVIRRLGGLPQAREFWIGRGERLARIRQEALAPLNRKLLVQDLLLPWLNAL